jgi:hypothetical protein
MVRVERRRRVGDLAEDVLRAQVMIAERGGTPARRLSSCRAKSVDTPIGTRCRRLYNFRLAVGV